MKVVTDISELRQTLQKLRIERSKTNTPVQVGFVPTMGFLHEGHASLLQEAKKSCEIVVLSIFVNPIQFGPNEDLDKYPRDEERDLQLARNHGVDVVFLPTVETMYPRPTKSKVTVGDVTSRLCGASRPGHFDGVTTVVTKLFNMIQPNKAFFGMKDAQQVAVIQQMVYDLNVDVEIIPCPIIRESDGLAMSSRNVYLSPEERKQALVLSQALAQAEAMLGMEEALTIEELHDRIVRQIDTAPLAEIDYVEILTFPTLEPLDPKQQVRQFNGQMIIALAVKFGKTRLIDNRLL